jgi:hypothetical protein
LIVPPFLLKDPLFLSFFLLFKAISAQNWSVAFWFEWNCIGLAALCARYFKRLPWGHPSTFIHSGFFQSSTIGTSNWFIFEPFFLIECLLGRGPNDFFTAISTD